MTNLLQAVEFPEKINVIQTDIDDYRELNKIIKGIPKHLESKKLFFFGNTNEIYKNLGDNGYKVKILDSISINDKSLPEYWDVLRVLLYSVTKYFLRRKGFYFHNNFAYMIEFDHFKGISLIKKDTIYNYYTHEGFDYKLHLIDKNVFLSLDPRIVLTWDKRSKIILEENGPTFYTRQWSKRYNTVIRTMLDVWVEFLSEKNRIVIPIQNENSLIFESNFSNAGSERDTKIEKIGQVSLNGYW